VNDAVGGDALSLRLLVLPKVFPRASVIGRPILIHQGEALTARRFHVYSK
jgi:hypothetical protein